MSTKTKRIWAMLGFTNVKDQDVVSRCTAVLTGLTGNANYPTPPVDLATYKSAIDALSAGIAESIDGSKKIIAAKNKDREAVIKMYRQLGTYVEANCKEDMAIFTSSGFQPAVNTRAAAQPLTKPVIKRVEQGANSGQLLVRVAAVDKAKSYELRYAPVANGVTGAWIHVPVPTVKQGVSVTGLTPGTIYSFEVRALGALGYTDWSDSANRMVI